MPDSSIAFLTPVDADVRKLQRNKDDGYNYRKRRDDDWTENYTLSRDQVIVDRLLQRQTVNLPVMKTVLRTLLKDVDDLPAMYFENLDNDKQAEIFKNEYWKIVGEKNKFDIIDIIDKRQVFEFGRTYSQWQIVDGIPRLTIVDARDMLVPRYNNPADIDDNSWLIHTHIFVPLSDLEMNPYYDKGKILELIKWYRSQDGLIKQAQNQDMFQKRMDIEHDIGINDAEAPILGETIFELSMHFVYEKASGENSYKLFMYVEAENQVILMKKPLSDVLGATSDNFWDKHFNYDTWADDVEKQDWYSDGIADIVRPTARVVNVWWSQLVENRTMRSLGMNFYDGGTEGFVPQTWSPQAWGWYNIPVPNGKKLSDVIQQVEIPALTDSLNEMQFAISMIEKATGATATQQGVENQKQITLGEVQLALTQAKERIKGMSKFYTQAWKDRGEKYVKLLESAGDKIDAVKVYKKGRFTDNIYGREIDPSDWKSANGYRCRVWSQEERDEQNTQAIEKQSAIKQNMPDNPIVDLEFKKKLLEFGGYTPDKVNEAIKFEEQKQAAMLMGGMMGGGMPGVGVPGQPGQQQPLALPQPQQALPAGGGR